MQKGRTSIFVESLINSFMLLAYESGICIVYLCFHGVFLLPKMTISPPSHPVFVLSTSISLDSYATEGDYLGDLKSGIFTVYLCFLGVFLVRKATILMTSCPVFTVYLYFLGVLCYWRWLFRRPQVQYLYCLPLLPWSLPATKGDNFDVLTSGLCTIYICFLGVLLLPKASVSLITHPVFALFITSTLLESSYWQSIYFTHAVSST